MSDEKDVFIMLWMRRRQNKATGREYWFNPYFNKSDEVRSLVLAIELDQRLERFELFYRIHSLRALSYDRFIDTSKTSYSQTAIYCLLFQ
jgi:hypothetical protein